MRWLRKQLEVFVMLNEDLRLLDINLQLFAEETDEDSQEELNDEPVDSQDDLPQDDVGNESKEDRVPLNKFLDEKRKRRELEKQIRELQGKNISNETKNKVNAIKDLVKQKGYDDDFADVLSEITSHILDSVPKSDREEQEILEDIQDFADENPEVLKHKKEIIEKVKKYRKADPDFSVEDALNLIKPSKIRLSELKTDIEQKQAMARRNVENKKVANSSSSSVKDPYPLDEADRKALKGLQEAQPDKGWTAEKFYKRRYNK
jgi:hypothetical protein